MLHFIGGSVLLYPEKIKAPTLKTYTFSFDISETLAQNI